LFYREVDKEGGARVLASQPVQLALVIEDVQSPECDELDGHGNPPEAPRRSCRARFGVASGRPVTRSMKKTFSCDACMPMPVTPGFQLHPVRSSTHHRNGGNMKHHVITGGGGCQLHLVEAGNPKGQPILFIHGFSQCSLAWSRQLDSDLARDYRLIAMDMRGHGTSERPHAGYDDSRPLGGRRRSHHP
jgi:hypothetical protein